MGTPGDKAKIGKVVQGELQNPLDPEQHQGTPPITTVAPAPASTTLPTAVAAPPLQGVLLHQQPFPQPSTSSTPSTAEQDMGLISRLPQFETFAAARPAMPGAMAATKPESLLEQASMEDYYAQTKYYPSGVSESLQTLYPSLPSRPKALDEPGPSGLQGPVRGVKTRGGLKRSRKGATAPPTASTSVGIKKTAHSCPVCHKGFVSAEKLSKHQQVHSGASQFKCEHCKKSFSSKFKLVRHALIHSDRKPFSCTVCERTFHRKDHLKNHIKVHSPSKKIYVCERVDCKKEYTSHMSYRKHQALHAAEEGSLQCQICSSTFTTKEEILYHLKIHAGSRTVKNPNEKKFTCDQCDRKFFTKKDVRRHMVVHTGMRDFLCQFCPQRFGRKDHLVRHIKKSHSKNVPPEDIETAIIKSEGTTPGSGPEATIVKPVSSVSIKTEIGEFSESSLSNPEQFQEFMEGVEQLLPAGNFDEITLNPSDFLPSTSAQAELKDLGSAILEDIEGAEGTETLAPEEEILGELNPELRLRLLEPTEETNLPLPGFSQTFQSPPPPP